METTFDNITPHLAKIKLFKDSSERQIWLVYREYPNANDQNYIRHMCQEWASLDRDAVIEYSAKEKKKSGEFNYHVYRAMLYLQGEEIAIKDLVHEKAFTDFDTEGGFDPRSSLILNDEEKPWISHILWHLDLTPENFVEIQHLPDWFIAVLAAQLGDKAFITLMSLAASEVRDRIYSALPQEDAERVQKYQPAVKDITPVELQAAETVFREACLALSVSYDVNEYSPNIIRRALPNQILIDTVNVRQGDYSRYIIGYPVLRSLEALPRLSIFGKLIYIAYVIRSKGHWGLIPFLRDETNPFFLAGLEYLREIGSSDGGLEYPTKSESPDFAKSIGKMKKDLLIDLERKISKAGEMILLMKGTSQYLSFADILALLWSFDDDMINPFPEESETSANIVRNSLEEYTYRELVCKLIYMGNKACAKCLVSIEMEVEEEPCRILFRMLATHLSIGDKSEEEYYYQLIRKGHLAETAKKIEMIREGFVMISRGYSPHIISMAMQVYLDGGQR